MLVVKIGLRWPGGLAHALARQGRHEHLGLEARRHDLRGLAQLRRQHSAGNQEDVRAEAGAFVAGSHLRHHAEDAHLQTGILGARYFSLTIVPFNPTWTTAEPATQRKSLALSVMVPRVTETMLITASPPSSFARS
jgi:hypothetical protein